LIDYNLNIDIMCKFYDYISSYNFLAYFSIKFSEIIENPEKLHIRLVIIE